jgi:hypothetical protein
VALEKRHIADPLPVAPVAEATVASQVCLRIFTDPEFKHFGSLLFG